MSIDRIPALLKRLYAIVAELEAAFPGRRFTPDGHLVGSIGEVLAAHHYGLNLLPSSTAVHDAITADGRLVQIKATHRDGIGLRSDCNYLLVLRLDQAGGFDEVYNGPGAPVWAAAGDMQDNGQRSIGISKLRSLSAQTDLTDRIKRVS